MHKILRAWVLVIVTLALLVYTFYGSTAQGTELDITIDFWGLVALIVLLVLGIRWVRRGS